MTALITALVLICTLILRIPCGPDCYIHLGDAVIFLGAMMLPRRNACFAAAVGASLADLIGGFAFWAPWTFFVKLIMTLAFGAFIDHIIKSDRNGKEIKKTGGIPNAEYYGLIVSCIIAVFGYFISEVILFGQWIGALACVGFNTIQVVVCAIVAILVSRSLYRSSLCETAYYHRPR